MPLPSSKSMGFGRSIMRILKIFNSLSYMFSKIYQRFSVKRSVAKGGSQMLSLNHLSKLLLVLTLLSLLYTSLQFSKRFRSDRGRKVHPDLNYPFFVDYPSLTDSEVQVIPMVHSVRRDSTRLKLSDGFRIVSNRKILSKDLQAAIARYTNYISLIGHISTKTSTETSNGSPNELLLDCSSIDWQKIDLYPQMGEDESYQLHINHTGSYLTSSTLTGFIRGLSTYVQLIEIDSQSKESVVPYVLINDRPRFVWRGLMLDVCRHWLPLRTVKRTLDAMEMSKLNVLHLHLSDDQGFRVKSVRYPLLHDRQSFFTQGQTRDLVEYARQRRIRVIPEFDIPGHTTSWFVGYPELATESRAYEVETRWGVMKPTMDPTKENTYQFLDEFFAEMTKLFPDEHFHIGGDEVEGSQWMSSAAVQRFIQEHRLKNKNGMQAYFNKRVQKLLRKYNKSMIGWEEIVEGTTGDLLLDKDAIIHSWKSRGSLIGAVKKGYRGLLSYGYYLNRMWLSRFHYKVDPISTKDLASLSEKQISQVLGGEACMWTEYVSDATLDSRLWPRVLAVAERLWSPATITNEQNLYQRLFRMDRLLEQLHRNLTYPFTYKAKLEALIVDPNQRKDMLHPFTILANCCEPRGIESRSIARRYSANTSLTMFVDALPSESEFIQRLESTTFRYESLHEVFKTWTINDIRLRDLFENASRTGNRKIWVQDIEQVSANLVHVGRIGLKVLSYGRHGVFPPDPNHDMRTWTLPQWISHQNNTLNRLENQVPEVRLAAVRPVRRLLSAIR